MKWTIFLALLASLAFAPRPVRASDQFFERSYAVVIGIDRYPHFRQLHNAVSDARAIAAYLHTQDYDQIITLYDEQATKQAIIAAMQNQLAPRLRTKDRVLVFFAGHGYTETLGGKDRGYIVPYDGESQSAGYISMDELLTLADYMSNARHQLFIMDSCYGGLLGAETRGSLVNPNVPDYLGNIAGRVTRQVLAAGGKNQEVVDGGSKGHSVFVDAILEALADGKADRNRNGYITFSELTDYLLPRASNRYQTPSPSVLPGNQGGEYLFRSPLARVASLAPMASLAPASEPMSEPLRSAEPVTKTSAIAADPSLVTIPTTMAQHYNTISVAVLDSQGHFIPGIQQSSFRVSQGGEAKTIDDFRDAGSATVAILIQSDSGLQQHSSEIISLAGRLIDSLSPADYIAVAKFDLAPRILTDFSLDRAVAHKALDQLQTGGFSESNLYDALDDLENRMKSLQGRKAIVVLSNGIDTFSKLTREKALAAFKAAGVPIYAVRLNVMPSGVGNRTIADQEMSLGAVSLKSFADNTGGLAFLLDAPDEHAYALNKISEALHGYQISFLEPHRQGRQANSNITVQLIDGQTNGPLRMVDRAGSEIPYRIVVTQMP
jgi:VWFA-related protein